MLLEVLIALLLGVVIFLLVFRRRSHVLKTEDGWWGVGPIPDGERDATIHPFKVTTSDAELEVIRPIKLHHHNHQSVLSVCAHKMCFLKRVLLLFSFRTYTEE